MGVGLVEGFGECEYIHCCFFPIILDCVSAR